MDAIQDFLSKIRADVDVTLDTLIPATHIEPTNLHEAIRWSLFAGGKRVRPALVYSVGRTFGVETERLARTAAAIEMIHTYSLIHDDLPAMDDDDLRRGEATCHKQFGEATAILAGDVLQTMAFKAIAEDAFLTPEIRIALIALIATASGTPAGMVSGQQHDLNAEGKDLSMHEIELIHSQKTGALISASALAGAAIGGASDDEVAKLKIYSSRLGLLFQITDDLLDVTQLTEILGKTAGKDAASEKATYPGHYGLEKTRKLAATLLKDAHEVLRTMNRDTTLLCDLADEIANRKR